MATFQLPSAVDPAVRMALTQLGGQRKYLHGYSVRNSYHIRLNYTAVNEFCQDFFIFKYNWRTVSDTWRHKVRSAP